MRKRTKAEVVAARKFLASLRTAKSCARRVSQPVADTMQTDRAWGVHRLFSMPDITLLQREADLMQGDACNALTAYLRRARTVGPWRRLAPASNPRALEPLKDRFPNCVEALATIERCMALSLLTPDKTLSLPPILLVGEPGVGKTRFVQSVGAAIGSPYHEIAFASCTAGWILAGHDLGWSGGRPGKIYVSLVESEIANPVFMLDEIDKGVASNFDPYGGLFSLLEPASAARFRDEAVPLPIDARRICWFASANDLSTIPEPILSRFLICRVTKPTTSESAQIVRSIHQDLVTSMTWGSSFPSTPTEDVVRALQSKTPREMRQILIDAAGSAALAGRAAIELSDLRMVSQRRRPGFI